MSGSTILTLPHLEAQPRDVRGLAESARDKLIVSALRLNGKWRVLSRFRDDTWQFHVKATNSLAADRYIRFQRLPVAFRSEMKEIVYRYTRRGRSGGARPEASTVRALVHGQLPPFLQHLETLGIRSLREVNEAVCKSYVDRAKAELRGRKGKPLTANTLEKRFSAVEALYEISQFTAAPMPEHPWPGETAGTLAGLSGGETRGTAARTARTPIIPDNIFSRLFQAAWDVVQDGDKLLELRDELQTVDIDPGPQSDSARYSAKNSHLEDRGWSGGVTALRTALTDLRIACYIVVASLSGCRNHEIALVRTGGYYSTVDDDGEVYWWMRSESLKTDEGQTEWMIPEAAVEALKVMDRFAAPYQELLKKEIRRRRKTDPADPEIASAEQHLNSVFVGLDLKKDKQVRTLSKQHWNYELKRFMQSREIAWTLASHQFRRTFAFYAARSQFGDLRYLKEHFKHWSIDMAHAYALNEHLAVDLFMDIQFELDDIKVGVVTGWFEDGSLLAGGYGASLMQWRQGREITLFRTRGDMIRTIAESTAIRSNGHAWCTADDNLCVGNLDVTRCGGGGGCDNAVIDTHHVPIYNGLYAHLAEMRGRDDIGPGGRRRVERDLQRCRDVLTELGHDPLVATA